MSKRDRDKKRRDYQKRQRERHLTGRPKDQLYMLVRRGLVQRSGVIMNGVQKKAWPVARTHEDAKKLAQFLKAGPGVVPARIGSLEGETVEGHMALAMKERCQLMVCVAKWEADGTPRLIYKNLENSWTWPWIEESDSIDFDVPDDGVDDDGYDDESPAVSIHALFDTKDGPNLSAATDPRKLLAKADIVLAVDTMTREEVILYGVEALKSIASHSESAEPRVLKVEIDMDTDEMERLVALVKVTKGRCDLLDDDDEA